MTQSSMWMNTLEEISVRGSIPLEHTHPDSSKKVRITLLWWEQYFQAVLLNASIFKLHYWWHKYNFCWSWQCKCLVYLRWRKQRASAAFIWAEFNCCLFVSWREFDVFKVHLRAEIPRLKAKGRNGSTLTQKWQRTLPNRAERKDRTHTGTH